MRKFSELRDKMIPARRNRVEASVVAALKDMAPDEALADVAMLREMERVARTTIRACGFTVRDGRLVRRALAEPGGKNWVDLKRELGLE